MNTNPLKSQKGVTIIEAVIASSLLSLVVVSTLFLMTTMLNLWCKGSSGTSANSHASLAMRKLVLDIEHGESAMVSTGKLYVTFPYYDTITGDYIRTVPGPTAVYYLSGPTGSEGAGTDLWKAVGASKTHLAKNVQSASFFVTTTNLVRVSITGCDQEGGAISPNLVQQSIKLRNS